MPKVDHVRDMSVSLEVKAPSGFAVAFLSTYVSELAQGRDDARLPLRYTIKQLAGLTLERDVTVRVEYVPKPGGAPAGLRVAWEPDMTFFPSFNGNVRAESTGDATCTLTIEGTYEVPGGVAGQMFDAVLGVRIAHGTLEELLNNFRDAIETDYRTRTEYA
jgi:hypothetical protein